MDPVLIEEVSVFGSPVHIVNMQLASAAAEGQGRLILITDDEVKSVPLQRCHLADSCRYGGTQQAVLNFIRKNRASPYDLVFFNFSRNN